MKHLFFYCYPICSKIHVKRMVKKMGVYSTVKETIKDAVSIAQQSDNIQLYKSILDAYNAVIELMSENADLKERVRELEKQQVTDEMLEFNSNVYWFKNDGPSTRSPYCSRCWDIDKKLVKIHVLGTEGKCPACKTKVYKCLYREKEC